MVRITKHLAWLLLCVLLVLEARAGITSIQQPQITFGAVRYKTTGGSWAWTSAGNTNIGRWNGTNGVNPSSDDDRYRSAYAIGPSYPAPPPNATMSRVKIYVSVHGPIGLNYTAKIVKLPDGNLDVSAYQTNWANVGSSSTTYFDNIPYYGDDTKRDPGAEISSFSSDAIQHLQNGQGFNIGVMSNNEETNLTQAVVDIVWEIEWNVPGVTLYFENSFGGGTLLVDGVGTQHGSSKTWAENSQHTLTAVDQQYANYYNVWNTSGNALSNWQKKPAGNNPPQPMGVYTRSLTYTVASADNNATLIADMKKRYTVSRNDVVETISSSSAGVVANIVEQNSGQVSAPITATINGIFSKFIKWSDGVVDNPRTVAPTDNTTLTANYKGNLRTGRPDLSDAKNQRRVISSGSAWALVYESMGDIWLTTSGDGGANWVTEVRLNTQQGAASNPTFSNVLWYGGTRPRYLVAWIEPGTGGTAVLHFQTVQLYPGLPVYWGWGDHPANNQDATNHKTLNEIPLGGPNVPSSWPLQTNARPVVQLVQSGSTVKTYFAYESASNGIQTGIMITPTVFFSDTYLEPYGFPTRWVRNASTYLSVQYPVIITYPSSFGFPAKTYVYYLSGGYASGLRIAQYDYDTSTESLLANPNNDYTYYSLQGAASPGNNTYGLVAEALYYGQYNVNYYYKPTYYGSSSPSLNTVYSNMRQPAIMFDQSTGFGSSSIAGTVVMKSTADNTFYQSPSLSAIGPNIAGIFAKEQAVSGDRSSIVVKTTTTPASLVRYSGSGLAKEASTSNAIVKAMRLWNDKFVNRQKLVLDFSGASVVFLDTLEHGSDICVVKVDNWKNSIVRQIDSLCTPLAVALKRDGTTLRSYPSSLWKNLTATSLPGIQPGDIITFTLPGESKAFGYSVIALSGNSLPKGNADEDVLTPTEKAVSVYPNPFNPTTTFKVSLPQPDRVQLAVYNSLGQKVQELLNEDMQAGEHFVSFNGDNLSSGAYFYRIAIGDKIQSGRLLLMK